MNKYKYLLQNTILFALSGVLVKVLSFLMLPLYTDALTTAEYGIAELMHTTITLITPFLSLSIAEAVIRFLLIKDSNRKAIFTASLLIIVAGTIILLFMRPIFTVLSEDIDNFFVYFVLWYFSMTLENMLFLFAKGLEKVKACSINGVVVVLVTVFTNLLLLLKFNMGLEGYLIAMIAAQVVSSIYLGIVCKVWKYFDIRKMDRKVTKEMLAYSIPFIPTAIAWWINSAFDRYMIVFFLGVAANGMFGAASKLPATINVITSVFIQAWQLSGVKEYGEEDYDSFFTNIYNLYNLVMIAAIAVLIPFTPLLAKFLFSGEFYGAWVYAPVLYISSLFSGLTGILASAFYAVKKTGFLMQSTLIGAAVNIVLNYLLIKTFGIQGAGIATMLSFAVVFLARLLKAKKYVDIKVHLIRDIISYALLSAEAYVIVMQIPYMYAVASGIVLLIFVLNIDTIKRTVLSVIKKIKKQVV